MMRVRFQSAILLACVSLLSCSQSGDFGTFFVREAKLYGAKPTIEKPPATVRAHWTSKSSQHGFDVVVRGASFQAIDLFMQQAFGPPRPDVQVTSDGRARHFWAAQEHGVTIQCLELPDAVQVTCGGYRPGR